MIDPTRSNGAAVVTGIVAAILVLFLLALLALQPGGASRSAVARSAPEVDEPVAPTPAPETPPAPVAEAEPDEPAEPTEPSELVPDATLFGHPEIPGAAAEEPSGLTISGRVIDAAGKPVAGAMVLARSESAAGGPGGGARRVRGKSSTSTAFAFAGGGASTATTDDEGRFVIRGVDETKTYALTAHGASMFAPEGSVGGARAGDEDVEIVLPTGASIAGRVVEGGSGEPVAGAFVSLRPAPDAGGNVRMRAISFGGGHDGRGGTPTDEDGRFEITGLAAGRYIARAKSDDHAPGESEPVAVAEGQRVDGVLIEVHPGVFVAGRVVDAEGQPIAGASVAVASLAGPRGPMSARMAEMAALEQARQDAAAQAAEESGEPQVTSGAPSMFLMAGADIRMARTDDAGEFLIEHLEPGPAQVSAAHADHAPGRARVTLPDAGGADHVEIVLPLGGRIVGTILGPDGQPPKAGGASINARSPTGGGNATIDAEGRYEISGLAAGHYRVSAHWGGGIIAVGGGNMMMMAMTRDDEEKTPRNLTETVVVEEGATRELDFDFSEAGSVRLVGSARLASGAAIANATLHISARSEGIALPIRAQTDDRGEFVVDELAPGRYSVTVGMDQMILGGGGGEELELAAEPAEQRVDLVFENGRVIVRAVDAGTGEPVQGVSVRLVPTAGSAEESAGPFGRHAGFGITDAEGIATVTVEALQPLQVHVGGGGFVTAKAGPVTVGPEAETRLPDVRLERGESVRLRVIDDEGRPIPDATARPVAGDGLPRIGGYGGGGEDGVLTLGGLAPGRQSIRVGANGFASKTVEVQVPSGDAPIDVILETGGTLTVSVVDGGGQPVASAKVTLEALGASGPGGESGPSFLHPVSETDGLGLFRRDHLAEGRYRVKVEREDGSSVLGDATVRAGEVAKVSLVLP